MRVVLMMIVMITIVTMVIVTASTIDSVPMKVINLSGRPIDLYWVAPHEDNEDDYDDDHEEGSTHLQKFTETPLRNSTDLKLESYDNHEFVVQLWEQRQQEHYSHQEQLGHRRKGNERPVVASAKFTKGPTAEEFRVYYDEAIGSLVVKKSTRMDDAKQSVHRIMDKCTSKMMAVGSDGTAGSFSEAYKQCLAEGLVQDIVKLADSKATLKKRHVSNAQKLREYTCADPTMKTSPTIDTITYETPNKTYTMNVLFYTPAAKIMYTPNFITPEECKILMNHGKPRLRRATVAAEDGSSIVSENRKAQQASYTLNGKSDPLGPLYERILNFTNFYTGYGVTPEGQEDFTIIQYDVSDQYKSHCDGACDGGPYTSGGRIATAVLYCKVPEIGGGLSFSQADVFVQPSVGTAAFFSYMGPNNTMDEGYTEHSSCPVVRGEKWATAVWMRLGVSEQRPWTILDPQGLEILSSSNESEDEDVEQNEGDLVDSSNNDECSQEADVRPVASARDSEQSVVQIDL